MLAGPYNNVVFLCRSKNHEELFNLQHAQLHNIVKQIIGIFKKWFRVMVIPQEYNVYTQAQIVAGLAIIHNFI